MEQFAIDFDAVRACRSSDPVSSVNAAEGAARFATGHCRNILNALRLHGAMTPKEMFTHTGLSVEQCDRRLPELKRAGLVQVVSMDDGADLIRAGCRVWRAV